MSDDYDLHLDHLHEAIMSDDYDLYPQPLQEKFKNRSPLVVKIKIYDRVDNTLIRDHTRDIRKGKNKDWLVCALMWAVQNQKRIEIERKE